MKQTIVEFLEASGAPAPFGALQKATGLSESELASLLRDLEAAGAVMRSKRGKYGLPEQFGFVAGRYSRARGGYGFVPYPGGEIADLFIPQKAAGDAWNGDIVLARAVHVATADRRADGAIERVLERAHKTVTGTLVKERKKLWLLPDDKRLPERILVSGGGVSGTRAAIRIDKYGDKPSGTFAASFGDAGSRDARADSILFSQGVPTAFPKRVLRALSDFPESVDASKHVDRLDLRNRLIFTIDGDDSKDLDDAVSLEWTDDSQPVLGVHIADVSHYVTESSPLDAEAFRRGTSVYYADRVVPMLPKELSNGICSLHGGVTRLALSVFMTLDGGAEIVDYSIHKSIISSRHRMTYRVCNDILEDRPHPAEYDELVPVLRQMDKLRGAFEARRSKRGAIDFVTTESKIVCDESGAPVDVVARKGGPSERLIESFMIAANETVARHLHEKESPAVYRTHETPDRRKLAAFYETAALFGHSDGGRPDDRKTLAKIIRASKGKPEETVLNSLLLRSMMKAKYSAKNTGHFGLSSDCYCHFTSPIRRYPDLLVHRMLKYDLDGTRPPAGAQGALEQAALHSSEREIAADTAEREIERLYKAEYMAGFVGETFEGSISGVMPFGCFVELKNTVEGLVPIHTLPEDEYRHDAERMALIGLHTEKRYAIGDRVSVRLVSANRESGDIDFEMADEILV